eukprot:358091-Chlamydomonas_euryale.AAC.6
MAVTCRLLFGMDLYVDLQVWIDDAAAKQSGGFNTQVSGDVIVAELVEEGRFKRKASCWVPSEQACLPLAGPSLQWRQARLAQPRLQMRVQQVPARWRRAQWRRARQRRAW